MGYFFTDPESTLPEFATDDVVDPTTGKNNVEEAETNQKVAGWFPFRKRPERQVMNWLHRWTYKNLKYWKDTFFPACDEVIYELKNGIKTGTTNAYLFLDGGEWVDYTKLIFADDFVTGNKINLKVNGSSITEVEFTTDNATTMGLLATALEAKTAFINAATVSDDNEITINPIVGVSVIISDIVVSGGATQTTGSQTYTDAVASIAEPEKLLFTLNWTKVRSMVSLHIPRVLGSIVTPGTECYLVISEVPTEWDIKEFQYAPVLLFGNGSDFPNIPFAGHLVSAGGDGSVFFLKSVDFRTAATGHDQNFYISQNVSGSPSGLPAQNVTFWSNTDLGWPK